MPKLDWKCSYETYLYSGGDGDLETTEYAEHPDGKHYIVRLEDKKRQNTRKVDKSFDVSGLTLVDVVGTTCYDEFILPNGKTIRLKGDLAEYKKRAVTKDHPQPSKNATNQELEEWQ